MEPYKCSKLPITYKKDDELLSLLANANEKYGEYKTNLKNMKFDSNAFLKSIILYEGLYSTKIEGTQITQDELYYIEYKDENDDIREIQNLERVLEFGRAEINKNGRLDLSLIKEMHKLLLESVRGSDKRPGQLRVKQNFIGSTNNIEDAIFIPPFAEEVPILLDNLLEYMNDRYIEPNELLNLAIAHAQFETIHPFNDGNGRLGRALIPLQLFVLKNEQPILFLSEVIERYKINYHNALNKTREGNYTIFIKFFLQCVIDQCHFNISRLERINRIFDEDMDIINNNFSGAAVHKIMPVVMRYVVVSVEKLVKETSLNKTTIVRVLQKLINFGILEKEKKLGTKRITYKYKKAYNIFASN